MPLSERSIKGLALLSVLVAGIVITAPYADYQGFLAQGDHGRDLYAAQAVYRGELPYKDFWWVYGPLMPYYYGLFFKLFGTKITSMILGKLLLRIAGGLMACLALMEVCSPLAAFFCACWFMLFQQDFFFTYNHIGGLVMVLGVVFCLLSYIRQNSPASAWGALAFIFVLFLIKLNFGAAALAVALMTIAVCDFMAKKGVPSYFYAVALVVLPLVVFIIYWSLLHDLSTMEIRECLPYKEGDQPYSTTPWHALHDFFQITWRTMKSNWMNRAFAVIINASALRCLYLLARNKFSLPHKRVFLLSLSMLSLLYVANFHEYLKSGVWYRAFWSQPLSIMLIFLLIDTATANGPKVIRKMVFLFIAAVAVYGWFSFSRAASAAKTDSHYLALPRGGVYVLNQPGWVSTVEETTAFLNKTLAPNQMFFALPYDCLYYYLTDRKTPSRQMIFFEHIKIPADQEKSVIAELEKNHVQYVLLSNRAFARVEPGLGMLGKTYCPVIGKYLQDNFTPLARFGSWGQEPGWAWNHGTLILKRK